MAQSEREAGRRFGKVYGLFAGAFAFFALAVAVLAELGLPEAAIAALIVLASLITYVALGAISRTLNELDFFHGGASVPGVFNGLATAAVLLSFGGFAGLAGVWFGNPDAALALTLGWVTGLVLMAVLVAPYFRKSGAATLPDFLALRFGGRLIRGVAVAILLVVSFAALAAAIAAGGTIASLFLGTRPGIAVAGAVVVILLSALFGGLRALLFVAGAQAIVLLIGLLVPGLTLSARDYGLPLPQFTYGYALEEAAATGGASIGAIAGRFLPLPALDGLNLFGLGIAAAAGTAVMPHLLMFGAAARTAAAARRSVAWALLAVVAALVTAAAYAAFARSAIVRDLVAAAPDDLPEWVFTYGGAGLVKICGIDALSVEAVAGACVAALGPGGVLRPADIAVGSDLIALGFADITDLPYVMTALLVAAGLAAALAGATALAVAIANTLGHDLYGRLIAPKAPAGRRLILTRLALAVTVSLAGWVAAARGDAMFGLAMVSLSLAAAGFFPAVVLGIWWKRTTVGGAVAGMAAGFGLTLFYAVVMLWTGTPPASFPRLGTVVSPIAAAIYGLPVGFLVMIGVSWASVAPANAMDATVDAIRRPGGGSH